MPVPSLEHTLPPTTAFPRVAHLIRPAQGGMRTQVRALLSAAPESALLAAPESVLANLAEIVPLSARYLLPEVASPKELLRAGTQVGRWARSQKAVLLHGHGIRWSPLFAAAAVASRLPLVITLHNLLPDASAIDLRERIALSIALLRTRRLICVSEAVAASARRLIPGISGRLRVVYNGVEPTQFRDAAVPTKEEARRLLGLPMQVPVALCVARLSPEKDVALFLEAASLLRRDVPEARFLVAGDGPLRPALEQQVALLDLCGQTALLGMREDIPLLLRAADVFCQPSREEGLGLAALEAMAAGLPVVATQVGGLAEVVANGETGFLVRPRDPKAFAEALRTLLLAPEKARAFGQAGRRRAEDRFTQSAMLAGTRAVYQETLGG